jgi:hypothetical protein
MTSNIVVTRALRAAQRCALLIVLAAALPACRAHAQLLPSLGLQVGAGYGKSGPTSGLGVDAGLTTSLGPIFGAALADVVVAARGTADQKTVTAALFEAGLHVPIIGIKLGVGYRAGPSSGTYGMAAVGSSLGRLGVFARAAIGRDFSHAHAGVTLSF